MKTCKIAIADPSVIVLSGLSALLRDLPEYEVVLQSDDMHTVMTRLRILRPDVLIINPSMIDYSKRRMVRSLFEDLPDLRVVALVSSFFDSQMLRQFQGVVEITDDRNGLGVRRPCAEYYRTVALTVCTEIFVSAHVFTFVKKMLCQISSR